MAATIKIRNWDKWQSYRKDRGQPPWIKVHRALMRDPNWVALSDAQRGQLVAMWMLAADRDGVIPASPAIIRKLCFMDSELDLNAFISLGFLDGCQDDANTTPSRRQDDAPETETETETETEKIGAGAPKLPSVFLAGEPLEIERPVTGPPVIHEPAAPELPPFDPSAQSAEERYWDLVGTLEKRGVARSMCGRLLKTYQDFEASRRCLEAAANAKDPARYIGKAISNMREEAKHEPIGNLEGVPKDWPEPIKEIIRMGGHVSWLRQNRWRDGFNIIDERGRVVGM